MKRIGSEEAIFFSALHAWREDISESEAWVHVNEPNMGVGRLGDRRPEAALCSRMSTFMLNITRKTEWLHLAGL